MASSASVSLNVARQFRPENTSDMGDDPGGALFGIRVDPSEDRFGPVGRPSQDTQFGEGRDGRSPYDLVCSAVATAVQSMETLQTGMAETARAFRWCEPAEANRRLVTLASGLRLLTTLADLAARAAGLNLTELNRRPGNGRGPLDAMGEALDQLSSQQFADDYQAMAETLAVRVSPALAGWREVFAEILMHADSRFRGRHA